MSSSPATGAAGPMMVRTDPSVMACSLSRQPRADVDAVVAVRRHDQRAVHQKVTLHLGQVAAWCGRVPGLPLVLQLPQRGVDDLHRLVVDRERRCQLRPHTKLRRLHPADIQRRDTVGLQQVDEENRLQCPRLDFEDVVEVAHYTDTFIPATTLCVPVPPSLMPGALTLARATQP